MMANINNNVIVCGGNDHVCGSVAAAAASSVAKKYRNRPYCGGVASMTWPNCVAYLTCVAAVSINVALTRQQWHQL